MPRLVDEWEGAVPDRHEDERAGECEAPTDPVRKPSGKGAGDEAHRPIGRQDEAGRPEREPAHVMQVDDEKRKRDPVPEGVHQPARLQRPDGTRKARVDRPQIGPCSSDQPSPRVAQTSSLERTRPMTSSVNSVVVAWPPRSAVRIPTETASRLA